MEKRQAALALGCERDDLTTATAMTTDPVFHPDRITKQAISKQVVKFRRRGLLKTYRDGKHVYFSRSLYLLLREQEGDPARTHLRVGRLNRAPGRDLSDAEQEAPHSKAAPAAVNEPFETYRIPLEMVQECRALFGVTAARRLWRSLPLPQPESYLED